MSDKLFETFVKIIDYAAETMNTEKAKEPHENINDASRYLFGWLARDVFEPKVKVKIPHIKVDESFVRSQIENARQEFVTAMLAASAKFKEKTGLKIIVSYKVDDFIKL